MPTLLRPRAALRAIAAATAHAVGGRVGGYPCPWLTQQASPTVLASEVLAQMSWPEKAAAIALSTPKPIENATAAVPTLCIPSLTLNDGPSGISTVAAPVSALPSPLALGA